MPRAHRYYVPHQIWHLTHRCHESAFLLKFARDRRRYLHWLREAKDRYGLQVLDYVVTSNHVHLLVHESDENVIARSIQLAAGRTAQEFNNRKGRRGAFWEDRYHATAIEFDRHLHRCIAYIDLNMVRAGAVRHPSEWAHCGYREIQNPRSRTGLIDICASLLCGFTDLTTFQSTHRAWVEDALARQGLARDATWTGAVAVGSRPFIAAIRSALGSRAQHRRIECDREETYLLREPCPA